MNVDDLRARYDEAREVIDHPAGWEWVRRAAWTVLALSLLAFIVQGSGNPTDPYVDAHARLQLQGFDNITFRITSPSKKAADWCAMLAANEKQREQGLMHQTNLRGYDGMVFQFPAPSASGFWMKNTIIPLAVAYFDSDGRFINAQGMDPCPADATDCPSYPADRPYLTAIEVPRGGLGALGIGPGATLTFPGGPCPS